MKNIIVIRALIKKSLKTTIIISLFSSYIAVWLLNGMLGSCTSFARLCSFKRLPVPVQRLPEEVTSMRIIGGPYKEFKKHVQLFHIVTFFYFWYAACIRCEIITLSDKAIGLNWRIKKTKICMYEYERMYVWVVNVCISEVLVLSVIKFDLNFEFRLDSE